MSKVVIRPLVHRGGKKQGKVPWTIEEIYAIFDLNQEGQLTLQEIGKILNSTGERIRQLLLEVIGRKATRHDRVDPDPHLILNALASDASITTFVDLVHASNRQVYGRIAKFVILPDGKSMIVLKEPGVPKVRQHRKFNEKKLFQVLKTLGMHDELSRLFWSRRLEKKLESIRVTSAKFGHTATAEELYSEGIHPNRFRDQFLKNLRNAQGLAGQKPNPSGRPRKIA
jgi:hypothetical protein